MKRAFSVLGCAVLFIFVSHSFSYGADEGKWARLVTESGNILSEVQQMPDKCVPRDLLEKCYGIAIFPSTVSAGLGIGGQYGQGIIMARDPDTGAWSAPAVYTIVGGSFGFQIGGQATDIILLIMSKRSVEGLIQSSVKLGADAAVSAGPVGRAAEAATDAQLKGGILSYSRSRGLFAGIKLEGSVVKFHIDGTKTLYGKGYSAREILVEHKAAMPASANTVLKVLKDYPFKKK
jgi:lipid-binding SYLF domain-containing protein